MGGRRTILKKIEEDKDVLQLAYDRTEHAFKLFDHVAVAFSGGKDSTAALNVAYEVAKHLGKLPLHVYHSDEEAIPMETEEFVRRTSQRDGIHLDWYALPVKHRNACSRRSPFWYPWAPEDEDKWVRPMPPEAITELEGYDYSRVENRDTWPNVQGLLFPTRKYGTVGMIMGIRADESITRYRAVARNRLDNYIIPWKDGYSEGNLWKVYSIYDWTTTDVWTAPGKFGWDYNRAYDVMDKAGVAWNDQRASPAYGEEPIRGLHIFKECFPEVWDKMAMRVPGANTAVRYARTELYSYGKRVEKPDDMSWEDFIAYYIKKFDPGSRAYIAGRIRSLIRRHYSITSQPILPNVAHPETGISWQFLAMLAQRGDFKQRKQPIVHPPGPEREAARMEYLRALADNQQKEQG